MTDKTAVEAIAEGIARSNYPSGTDADIEEMWTGFEFDAQAALDAYHEWLKANGFAVVPVEPSEAIEYKGLMALHSCGLGVVGANETDIHDIYRAMIAAAQGG